MTDRIPFHRPDIGEREIERVSAVLRSGWLTTGPETAAFEREFAAAVGAPAALAVNSCTSALHLGLLAAGVRPGDEVVTSPLTFCSTVHVIEHVGARPVLADVEPDTLNLDPAAAARAVTGRTRALLPVHYGGHPCEMDAFAALAKERGLEVLEDAAHAAGARYRGRPVGSGPGLAAFSFYATKTVATGEGGMLVGAPDRIDRARVSSLHGMTRDAWKRYEAEGSWRYDVVEAGFKYNLPDVLSSIGRVQLDRMASMQARRRAIAERYGRAFGSAPCFDAPRVRPHAESAWHLYPVRLKRGALRIDRSRFIEELRRRGIGASVHFIPIPMLTYYRERYGWRPEEFPVAAGAFEGLISLPLYSAMTDAEVERVAGAVGEIAAAHAA